MPSDSNEMKTFHIVFQRGDFWSVDIVAPTANKAKQMLWNDTYDKSTEKWLSGDGSKEHRQTFRVESCTEVHKSNK